LAPALIRCKLVHESLAGIIAGRIAETEAYSEDGAASPTDIGKMLRSRVMFKECGNAYVYFTYAM
jgi:3-methyladenine DNA glycosylase Mpg